MLAKLKQVLRSNRSFYKVFRRQRNRYQIWQYILKYIHPTVYVSSKSHIGRDLVAHEYGFINTGCWIGSQVELGPYIMFGPGVAIIGVDHHMDRPPPVYR
jgi:UDP-3-O-[3-hydroxymyristoyl] glucosamine N-acyltransferase